MRIATSTKNASTTYPPAWTYNYTHAPPPAPPRASPPRRRHRAQHTPACSRAAPAARRAPGPNAKRDATVCAQRAGAGAHGRELPAARARERRARRGWRRRGRFVVVGPKDGACEVGAALAVEGPVLVAYGLRVCDGAHRGCDALITSAETLTCVLPPVVQNRAPSQPFPASNRQHATSLHPTPPPRHTPRHPPPAVPPPAPHRAPRRHRRRPAGVVVRARPPPLREPEEHGVLRQGGGERTRGYADAGRRRGRSRGAQASRLWRHAPEGAVRSGTHMGPARRPSNAHPASVQSTGAPGTLTRASPPRHSKRTSGQRAPA